MLPVLQTIMDAMGGSILGGVQKLINEFHMSPAEAAKIQEAIAQREHELQLVLTQQITAQLEINKIEAAHPSRFVSGWRPFIGWVCGAGLAWEYVLKPFVAFFIVVAGIPLPPLPDMGVSMLMGLVQAMLGLAGMRTYERFKGVERTT